MFTFSSTVFKFYTCAIKTYHVFSMINIFQNNEETEHSFCPFISVWHCSGEQAQFDLHLLFIVALESASIIGRVHKFYTLHW